VPVRSSEENDAGNDADSANAQHDPSSGFKRVRAGVKIALRLEH
jgi:hypothetical protein